MFKLFEEFCSTLQACNVIEVFPSCSYDRFPPQPVKVPFLFFQRKTKVDQLDAICCAPTLPNQHQANERYAHALGTTLVEDRLKDVLGPACRRVTKKGRRYRALNPWSPQDSQLLSFFGKGEQVINGFRNKDLTAKPDRMIN